MNRTVSIFIVNYNTCEFLEQCLESIFDTRDDLRIEVFVADNNSSDGSPEMVKTKFPQVRLTEYPENLGYSKSINPLLPLASGNYYLFLHPDVKMLSNAFKHFLEFFESHPQAGIVGGNLYYPDGTPNPCEVLWPGFANDLLSFTVRIFSRLPPGRKLLENYNPTEWSHKSTCLVNAVWNACMMVRKEVFDEIGCFDEALFYGSSDWDLCKRAAHAGWLAYYLHPAKAIHYERQSFGKDESIRDEIRYKVDGWHSALWIYKDRYVFLKKHCSSAAILGVKAVYFMENMARLWLICWNIALRRVTPERASFSIGACLRTLQAILKT